MNFYFTFNDKHSHRIKGVDFNANTVCKITAPTEEEARAIAFRHFSIQWSFIYTDGTLDKRMQSAVKELPR